MGEEDKKADQAFTEAAIGEEGAARELARKLTSMRQAEKFSKEELAHITRISIEALTALEEAKLDQLPSKVFVRGFLKNICNVLNQRPDELLSIYERCFEKAENVEQFVEYSSPLRKPKARKLRIKIDLPGSRTIKILGASVVGLVLCLILPLLMPLADQHRDDRGAEPSLPVVAKEKAEEVVGPPKEQSSTKAALKKEIPAEVTPKISSRQLVKVQVSEPVKIKYKLDSGNRESKVFEMGLHKFEFDSTAELLIYDAGAVEVLFNEKNLGFLGNKGRLRRISFKNDRRIAKGVSTSAEL